MLFVAQNKTHTQKQANNFLMQIIATHSSNVLILKIKGRITVSDELLFKGETAKYSENEKNIVLDCSEMEYIDSTGLGLIVRFFKSFTSTGGKLALASLQPKPKLVFEITRAYKIFDIFDTTEAAIASFEKH